MVVGRKDAEVPAVLVLRRPEGWALPRVDLDEQRAADTAVIESRGPGASRCRGIRPPLPCAMTPPAACGSRCTTSTSTSPTWAPPAHGAWLTRSELDGVRLPQQEHRAPSSTGGSENGARDTGLRTVVTGRCQAGATERSPGSSTSSRSEGFQGSTRSSRSVSGSARACWDAGSTAARRDVLEGAAALRRERAALDPAPPGTVSGVDAGRSRDRRGAAMAADARQRGPRADGYAGSDALGASSDDLRAYPDRVHRPRSGGHGARLSGAAARLARGGDPAAAR